MTKRKKNCRRGAVLIGFSACLFLTGYPLGANWLFERRQDLVRAGYEEEIVSHGEEDRKAEWEKAAGYNRKLSAGAWQEEELKEDYENCLNIGEEGIMGFLEIPGLQVILPIYHGVKEEVLQKGLGHLPQTSLPIGQKGAHVGIIGHSGVSNKRLFSDLEQLEEGDFFKLHVMGQVLRYRVERIEVVLPTQTEGLEPEAGKDYVTLITCTPYGINDHRLLVRGTRSEESSGKEEKSGKDGRAGPSDSVGSAWKARYREAIAEGLFLSAAVVLIYLSGGYFRGRRNRRSRKESGI
ncbi:MAG: class C sortase [Lachnospiraceae bacterium]|nr:class C sortase [Lachnospiraceae bacterium]